MAKERYMPCPVSGCRHEEWVSPEDEDTSFSMLWDHVLRETGYDREKTRILMMRVDEVDRDV